MLKIEELSDESARYAMEHGEFEEKIRKAAGKVAVVLSQGWCPQWTSLRRMLKSMEGSEAEDIRVFTLVYDKKIYFEEFKIFKERHFANVLIPYIRYYRKGTLVAETNYVDKTEFLKSFNA